jgi:protein-disulfide isomerase
MRHPAEMPRSRLVLIGGVVAAAVVVAVVLVVVATGTGGGSKNAATTTSTRAAPSGSLFAGIRQRGFELGKASAPNTLLVFEDPQCPYCRQWNEQALPAVVRDYVRTGRVKLDYRGIEIIGPNSLLGLRANYAAGEQNKLWNMSQALYDRQGEENSGWITDAVIRDAATAAHANAAKLLAAMKTTAVTQAIAVATQEAQQIRLQGTPTFVLQRPLQQPQELQVTGLDAQSFESTLASALQ